MKLHNLCGNCNEEFSSNLIVREIIIECPGTVDSNSSSQWKSIKVSSALSSIYKLGYIEQLPHIDQAGDEDDDVDGGREIAVCGLCADDLTNLWKFYEQLRRRRRANSYVAKKIDKLNGIFQEIQTTWSQMVSDIGDGQELDDSDEAPRRRGPGRKAKYVRKISKHDDDDDVLGPSQTRQQIFKHEKKSARLRMKEDTKYNNLVFNSNQEHSDEPDSNLDDLAIDLEDGEGETSPVSLEPVQNGDEDPLAIFENEDDVTTESTAVNSTLHCPICSDSFLTPLALSDHWLNDHTEKGSTICPLPSCQRSFASSSYIKVHLDGHVDYKRFPCTVAGCPKAFTTLGNLQRHIISCRNGRATKVKPRISKVRLSLGSVSDGSGGGSAAKVNKSVTNSCPLCQRAHASSADLSAHLFSSHIEEDSLTCPICSREVSGKGPLRMHIYAHAGGKVSCNKRNSTVQMRERMRDSADYVSSGATKRRKLESHRQMGFKKYGGNVHITKPTNVKAAIASSTTKKKKKRKAKRYACTSCRKVCRSAFALKLHKRIHTGEKPYKCGLCGYSSAQSGNLKVHLWQHAKTHDNMKQDVDEKDTQQEKKDDVSEPDEEKSVATPLVIEIEEDDKSENLMEVTNDDDATS